MNQMKHVLFSLAMSLTMANATAAPTTWFFNGNGISGALTVDLSLLDAEPPAPDIDVWGSSKVALPGEISPLTPSHAFDVIVGRGTASNSAVAYIGHDQFGVSGHSANADGSFSGIQLRVIGDDIFPLDLGLDLTQPVDWLAPGAEAFFEAYHYTGEVFSALYSGRIESMSVRTVPLPATVYLVLLGLLGLAATARKGKRK